MPQSRPRMGGITAMSVTSLQRIEAEVSQAISDAAAPGPASAALLREAAEIVERYGAQQPEAGDQA